jgi:epimerase transport system membrane fusion protein
LAAALSRQARLEAAVSQAAIITFPIELQRLIEWDPSLQKVMQNQADLFASNRQSDLGEVQIYSERITQLHTRLKGLARESETLMQQRRMVEAEIKDLQALYDKGLIQKRRLIERQEDLLEIDARLSQRETERQDALDQIAEIEERQLQIARDRRTEIAQEQQILTENIFDLRQRIRSFEEVLTRLDIRAPISGRIVGFEANTIGSVIQPGEVLMQIVPKNAPFIVEAQIATSDVDQVEVGRDARVRLSAYSFRTTPPIEGEVTYVSADSFFNEADNLSFYRIHVRIEEDAYAVLPDAVSPQPGMPVQVMVATGEQTVLTYLLDPVLSGLETAMIESD